MSESYHVYPVSDNPSIGHHVIELVISSPLFTDKDGIQVWTGSAPEQIEALVASHLRAKGFSEEDIAKL